MLRVPQPRSTNAAAGSPRDPGLSGACGPLGGRGAGADGRFSGKLYEGGKIDYSAPAVADYSKQLDYNRPYDSKGDYQKAFDARQLTPRPNYSAMADIRGIAAVTPRHRS